MAAHSIRNQEEMSDLSPFLGIGDDLDGEIILVVTALHAYVGQACMLNLVMANHQTLLPYHSALRQDDPLNGGFSFLFLIVLCSEIFGLHREY
jgi:hypothetical protein